MKSLVKFSSLQDKNWLDWSVYIKCNKEDRPKLGLKEIQTILLMDIRENEYKIHNLLEDNLFNQKIIAGLIIVSVIAFLIIGVDIISYLN